MILYTVFFSVIIFFSFISLLLNILYIAFPTNRGEQGPTGPAGYDGVTPKDGENDPCDCLTRSSCQDKWNERIQIDTYKPRFFLDKAEVDNISTYIFSTDTAVVRSYMMGNDVVQYYYYGYADQTGGSIWGCTRYNYRRRINNGREEWHAWKDIV